MNFFSKITFTFHHKFQLGSIFATTCQLEGNKLALTINLAFKNFLHACFTSIATLYFPMFLIFLNTLRIQPLMQVVLVLHRLWRLHETFALYLKSFLSWPCELTSLLHLVLDHEEIPGGTLKEFIGSSKITQKLTKNFFLLNCSNSKYMSTRNTHWGYKWTRATVFWDFFDTSRRINIVNVFCDISDPVLVLALLIHKSRCIWD